MQDLITKIELLLAATLSEDILNLQVHDVKTQWKLLFKLFMELTEQADRTRESFLLQFSWILQQLARPNVSFSNSYREFIIQLLIDKAIEIDQTSDLLGIVSRTYGDVLSDYTPEYLSGNTHLLLLSNNHERQRYINQIRHDLLPQVVNIARLGLQRHEDYLRRNEERQATYTTFLNKSSPADLSVFFDTVVKHR